MIDVLVFHRTTFVIFCGRSRWMRGLEAWVLPKLCCRCYCLKSTIVGDEESSTSSNQQVCCPSQHGCSPVSRVDPRNADMENLNVNYPALGGTGLRDWAAPKITHHPALSKPRTGHPIPNRGNLLRGPLKDSVLPIPLVPAQVEFDHVHLDVSWLHVEVAVVVSRALSPVGVSLTPRGNM